MTPRAADTWRLGCQDRVLGMPSTLDRAPGCSHLALGLPSLGRSGQTLTALGYSPRARGSAAPRPWVCTPARQGLQT